MTATLQQAPASAEELLARLDHHWQQALEQMTAAALEAIDDFTIVADTLKELRQDHPALADQWMRGKRALWHQLAWSWSGSRARSSAYEWSRGARVSQVLYRAGLVDAAYRDRETGRRVKTLIRELGRVDWNRNHPGDRDALIASYYNLRDAPIDDIKASVQAFNNRTTR